MKICTKCKFEKNKNDFSIRNGKLRSICKSCRSIQEKNRYNVNKEEILLKRKVLYDTNPQKDNARSKAYRESNKEKMRVYFRNYIKNRRKNDIVFKFKNNISRAIHRNLTEGKQGNKTENIFKSIGYDLNELKNHIESQFDSKMNWDNYGKWHVDHIKPVCSYNFSSITDEKFKECWSLKNLRPLWANDNHKKIIEDRKQSIYKKYAN
jgi:hypothetical protein